MSNSIITLTNHFNGNDTIVVNIEGKIIVHNGCQTFKLSSLTGVQIEGGV